VRSDLEIRDLVAIVAVADTGTVVGAAQRLGLSASPLSRQVRSVERRTGLVLFERRGQRLHLTGAGARFVDEARAVLTAVDQLTEHVRTETAQPPTRIAVGCVDAALHAGLVARGIAATLRSYPGVAAAVVLARSGEQIARLRRGDLDVALVHTPPFGDRLLTDRLVLEDPLVLLVAHGSATAAAGATRPISPADLDGQPWILDTHRRSAASVERFLERAQTAGFRPDVRYHVADLAARVSLVAAGLGCTLLPAASAAALVTGVPGVVVLDIPWLGLTNRVYAVSTRRPTRAAAAFLSALPDG
jgi:DNA-binding transcriptional LysR family regulator